MAVGIYAVASLYENLNICLIIYIMLNRRKEGLTLSA